MSKEKEEILKLEEQTELLSSDDITEEQLQEILKEVEEEEAAEDKKENEHNDWLAKREAKILEIKKILTTHTTAPRSRHERLYHSDQSGSELDSTDAADSPHVADIHDQDQSESVDNSSSTLPTPNHTPTVTTPLGVSSPSSSPLLTALLHSPSKTTSFPTSPKSHYQSNPYKTPTSGTNLLHKFSPTTTSTLITPSTTTISTSSSSSPSKSVPATPVPATEDKADHDSDKEDDVLADIDELLKDKVREGEITKEDIAIKQENEQKSNDTEIKMEVDKVKEEDIKQEETLKETDPPQKPMITETEKSSPDLKIKPEAPAIEKIPESIDPKVRTKSGDVGDGVHGLDGVESVPGSPLATPAGSRSLTPTPPSTKSVTIETESDRDYKAWKKSIILVWSQISQHKNANLFANAVTEADAPDYRDIVFRPMDLNSIKKNVESGHIKTTEEFERDLMLMFFNATMYNSSDHEVYKLTKDMHEDTEKILRDYKNAQLLLKESEPKSLRGKSESAETIVTRPRGRSVSGSVTDTPVSSRSDTRKRERSGSMMLEESSRADKKRKV